MTLMSTLSDADRFLQELSLYLLVYGAQEWIFTFDLLPLFPCISTFIICCPWGFPVSHPSPFPTFYWTTRVTSDKLITYVMSGLGVVICCMGTFFYGYIGELDFIKKDFMYHRTNQLRRRSIILAIIIDVCK